MKEEETDQFNEKGIKNNNNTSFFFAKKTEVKSTKKIQANTYIV